MATSRKKKAPAEAGSGKNGFQLIPDSEIQGYEKGNGPQDTPEPVPSGRRPASSQAGPNSRGGVRHADVRREDEAVVGVSFGPVDVEDQGAALGADPAEHAGAQLAVAEVAVVQDQDGLAEFD